MLLLQGITYTGTVLKLQLALQRVILIRIANATGAIYSYTVKAFDAVGNISTASNEALVVY